MTGPIKTLAIFFSFLLLTSPGMAQKTIRGTVKDATDGETLPSANISIENTYRGTISNSNGRFVLTIPDSLLPATVVVRYLGFNTETRVITAGTDETQDFNLEPSTLELGEITVTGEDPAVSIMKEVIRRKQQWRKRLETYRAEAYTRQTLANDTSIVMITESVSEAFWDREQGHREVLKSKRQTANIETADNFAGVSYLPNLYDDNVEIAGFDLVGVTHPDALKFYKFTLEDYKNIDDQVVYEIRVTPDRRLQPLFDGVVYVLDREYALLEVSLQPNDVVTFPPPVKDFNTSYEQQFNNFGKAFWLPVDMRIEGDVKVSMIGLEFPLIKFRQISQITNYEVNVSLPDSLYDRDATFSVDSTTMNNDSLFVKAIQSVPLSDEEEEAYASLDSTTTLEKAFRPSGFLARFVDDDEEEGGGPGLLSKVPGDLGPSFRFNRVDEFFVGLNYSIEPWDELELSIDGGYSTGYREWGYGAGISYRLFRTAVFSNTTGIEYKAHTAPQFRSNIYTPVFTLIPNFLGEPDYYNYYRSEGFRFNTSFEHRSSDLSAAVGFNSYEHTSLDQQSSYDILGRDQSPQVNPGVDEGRLNSVDLVFGYNLDEEYSLGVIGLNRVRFTIEYSDRSLGSDFDFTRYQADVDWSIPTFYRRRLLSNSLDMKVTAGTYSGDLPLQKLGVIDGTIEHFSPFGSLKTRQGHPYLGEQFLMVNAEHNFRTVPFEALGLRKLVEWNWGLILFAGAGKTWISDTYRQNVFNNTGYLPPVTNDIHWEAGVSLNGLFGLFRVDFARRMDQPAYVINVSVARIF